PSHVRRFHAARASAVARALSTARSAAASRWLTPSSCPPNASAMEVIAHRGASGTCPENTIPAFRRAAQVGAHMVELDVQPARDGQPVVIHDWTLDRTTSGRGSVRRRTLAEIATLDAGSWFD